MKIVIVDSRISCGAERKLRLLGFNVLTLPPFSKLSEAVASHTDMLLCRVNNELVSYADYCEEASYVFSDLSFFTVGKGLRFTFTADEVAPEYPNDVGLNALVMGKRMFCRKESASSTLIALAERNGYEIVNVKQGYPACTVLKLSDEAALTADRGMAKILTEHGIRVTLIEQGNISLPPHEYGFIGGAGSVHKGNLYLFGDVSTHPDGDRIIEAAAAEGLKVTSLCNGVLRDLGGMLFIDD